jgi:3-methylfumaryl-CoA hydratase
VHGPLQALLLADLARRAYPILRVLEFNYRAHAPAFDLSPLRLIARRNGAGKVDLAAVSAGVLTMRAEALVAAPVLPARQA